jgi:hypothetical protein
VLGVAATLAASGCAGLTPPSEPPLACGAAGGPVTRTWPDGQADWCTGAGGAREGEARFHARGFRVDGTYHDDRPTGRWRAWWPSGRRAGELDFDAGVPHGRLVAWYENGRTLAEGAFSAGRVSTPVVFYDDRGRRRYRLDPEASGVMDGHAFDERGVEIAPEGDWLPSALPEAYDLLLVVLTFAGLPAR